MEKRLYKSTQDRAIMGVCGGIAEYFEMDSVIVRLLAVIFTLMGGAGILAYIIAAIVIPERPNSDINDAYNQTYEHNEQSEETEKHQVTAKGKNSSKLALGIVLVFVGIYLLLKVFLPFFDGRILVAGALILIGIGVIAMK